MKPKVCIFAILVLSLTISSCQKSDVESASNYWNFSQLAKNNLNGKVKSITYDDGIKTEYYNESGNIIKSSMVIDNFLSTYVYNYSSAGLLSSVVTTAPDNTIFTTTYTYGKFGKYVIEDPKQLSLVYNLKSVSSDFYSSEYEFVGSKLSIYTNSKYGNDTTLVSYSGYYPSSIQTSNSTYSNIQYYPNGMFKSYTFTLTDSESKRISKYYYRENAKYMMVDSIVQTYVLNDRNIETTYSFQYDENGNLITEVNDETTTSYSYVYDENKNWTKKMTKTTYKDGTVRDLVESRTILYY